MHCNYIYVISTGDEGIPLSSSRGGHWPGVSAALLDKLAVDSEERRRLSGGVTTKKSSVAHSAVVRARDAALQVSLIQYHHTQYSIVPCSSHRNLCCVWRRWF